jgi:hypothetical protein
MLASGLNSNKRNTDFDEFAGTWSAEAAAQFDANLAAMRTIDPQDWKP